jgi:hypothetical protein
MEAIEMFQTNDGTLHTSEAEAKSHMADKLCEVLDRHLIGILDVDDAKPLNRNHVWHRSEVVDIVNFLVGDYDKAKQLINDLYKTLE